MSLQEMEQQANKLIEQGEVEPAVNLIYDLVVAWALAKDFSQANIWRGKLIEIDPMALVQIVKSGEFIESEKAKLIDDDYKTIWKELRRFLTLEENNSFYMKLKQGDFPPEKLIIQQGELNNTLFFIDSGQLKTFFIQNDRELFLNRLEQGETAGQDTFFNISNCTTTIITASFVKLRFLDRSALLEMEKEFPGFTTKLESFCSRLEAKNNKTTLKIKALERREFQRYKLAEKITAQIIDERGNPDGPVFYGQLKDISIGGACFSIKCSKKDVGRTLLGREATLSTLFEIGSQIIFNGLILGVRFDHFSSYTINLQFSKPFDESTLKDIVAILPQSTPTPPAMP